MLSHINSNGKAVMVNITNKLPTLRIAIAEATIKVPSIVYDSVKDNNNKKGDIIAVSRLAGIMASKKTHDLIPLCHQINLDSTQIDIHSNYMNEFIIRSTVKASYKTGVEMEALTAVTVASLTFYDMCKALSHNIIISNIKLLNKSGGKSGGK